MESCDAKKHPIRVCYPFVGNNVGGSHISTTMLIAHLNRRLVEPCVVLHEEGKLSDYLGSRGMDFELLQIAEFFKPPYWSLRNFASLLAQTWRISRFLRRRRIDVVHANDVRIHFGWTLASLAPRRVQATNRRILAFPASSAIPQGLPSADDDTRSQSGGAA